jgi:hypothetical protein
MRLQGDDTPALADLCGKLAVYTGQLPQRLANDLELALGGGMEHWISKVIVEATVLRELHDEACSLLDVSEVCADHAA